MPKRLKRLIADGLQPWGFRDEKNPRESRTWIGQTPVAHGACTDLLQNPKGPQVGMVRPLVLELTYGVDVFVFEIKA